LPHERLIAARFELRRRKVISTANLAIEYSRYGPDGVRMLNAAFGDGGIGIVTNFVAFVLVVASGFGIYDRPLYEIGLVTAAVGTLSALLAMVRFWQAARIGKACRSQGTASHHSRLHTRRPRLRRGS
jgi:hypothetical protein